MNRQTKTLLAGGMIIVLLAVIYLEMRQSQNTPRVTSADSSYPPLNITNPGLRTDLLADSRSVEYAGRHRDIFSATLPPPPPNPNPTPGPPPGPQVPPTPPALVVPVKFFGVTVDNRTGKKTAFFTDGDDVFTAAEGEMLMRRFKVVHIGNASVDVEEEGSGRRATLPIEQDASGSGTGTGS